MGRQGALLRHLLAAFFFCRSRLSSLGGSSGRGRGLARPSWPAESCLPACFLLRSTMLRSGIIIIVVSVVVVSSSSPSLFITVVSHYRHLLHT